jgi:AcrR family transcriptional regulator
MARKYSMDKRTAAVDETRRRIVEATRQMHNEKGILATTMQDIAARADVALGTVYRHFPSLDELVPACGALNLQLNPLPTSALFAGAASAAERLGLLVQALFANYERGERQYTVGYSERDNIPVLRRFMDEGATYVATLVRQAIEPAQPSEEAMRLAVALSDFRSWQALTQSGFTSEAAANQVVELIERKLAEPLSGAGRGDSPAAT